MIFPAMWVQQEAKPSYARVDKQEFGTGITLLKHVGGCLEDRSGTLSFPNDQVS